MMQLENTKHKVYIYNIDDELSSSDGEPDDGRLVFIPDIEKHLLSLRIPPRILANNEAELAGMQLVLYRDPEALTVSPEQDAVRKAVAEAKERFRENQRYGREEVVMQDVSGGQGRPPAQEEDPDAMDMS